MFNKPKLYSNSGPKTLAVARIIILSIWLLRLGSESVYAIQFLDVDLFFPQGIMKAVPASIITLILEMGLLEYLRFGIIGGLLYSVIGFKQSRSVLVFSLVALTFYLGLLKGFGGHVNHRELLLLYLSYLLIFLPCYDAISMSTSTKKDPHCYVTAMQLIVLVISISYLFVGLARLWVGTPSVFLPGVMEDWINNRNLRPNPYDFSLGLEFTKSSFLRYSLILVLPLATILEISFPIIFFCGKSLRFFIITAMMSLHIGIFILMNIPFIENFLLLPLCYGYLFDDREKSLS